MSGHVVSVVRDVAGHAPSHSLVGFCSRTGQVQGNVIIQQFVSDWLPIAGVSR